MKKHRFFYPNPNLRLDPYLRCGQLEGAVGEEVFCECGLGLGIYIVAEEFAGEWGFECSRESHIVGMGAACEGGPDDEMRTASLTRTESRP